MLFSLCLCLTYLTSVFTQNISYFLPPSHHLHGFLHVHEKCDNRANISYLSVWYHHHLNHKPSYHTPTSHITKKNVTTGKQLEKKKLIKTIKFHATKNKFLKKKRLKKNIESLGTTNSPSRPSFLANNATYFEWSAREADEFLASNSSFLHLPRNTTFNRTTAVPRSDNWQVFSLLLVEIAAVVGNSLVCLSVALEKRLRTITNYILVSLAIADLLVSLIVMPGYIAQEFKGFWPFGLATCAVWQMSDVTMCTSSIMHMCIISLDRFKCIRDPLSIRDRSKCSVALRITSVWAFAICISSPLAFLAIFRPEEILNEKVFCIISNPNFLVYGSIAAFFLPLIVMLITYSLTINLLRKKASENETSGGLRRTVSTKKLQPQNRLESRGSRSSNKGGSFCDLKSSKNVNKYSSLKCSSSPQIYKQEKKYSSLTNNHSNKPISSMNNNKSICYYQIQTKAPMKNSKDVITNYSAVNLYNKNTRKDKDNKQEQMENPLPLSPDLSRENAAINRDVRPVLSHKATGDSSVVKQHIDQEACVLENICNETHLNDSIKDFVSCSEKIKEKTQSCKKNESKNCYETINLQDISNPQNNYDSFSHNNTIQPLKKKLFVTSEFKSNFKMPAKQITTHKVVAQNDLLDLEAKNCLPHFNKAPKESQLHLRDMESFQRHEINKKTQLKSENVEKKCFKNPDGLLIDKKNKKTLKQNDKQKLKRQNKVDDVEENLKTNSDILPSTSKRKGSLKEMIKQQQEAIQNMIKKYEFKSSMESVDEQAPLNHTSVHDDKIQKSHEVVYKNNSIPNPKIEVSDFSTPQTTNEVFSDRPSYSSDLLNRTSCSFNEESFKQNDKGFFKQISLRGTKRKKLQVQKQYSTSKSVTNERKAVKVLGLMFAMFVACWFTFFCANFAMGVCPECKIDETFFKYVLWLGYTSSLINPIIYTVFNLSFRNAFIRILTCQHCFSFRNRRRKYDQQFLKYN